MTHHNQNPDFVTVYLGCGGLCITSVGFFLALLLTDSSTSEGGNGAAFASRAAVDRVVVMRPGIFFLGSATPYRFVEWLLVGARPI